MPLDSFFLVSFQLLQLYIDWKKRIRVEGTLFFLILLFGWMKKIRFTNKQMCKYGILSHTLFLCFTLLHLPSSTTSSIVVLCSDWIRSLDAVYMSSICKTRSQFFSHISSCMFMIFFPGWSFFHLVLWAHVWNDGWYLLKDTVKQLLLLM